jgi:hypothetical protein
LEYINLNQLVKQGQHGLLDLSFEILNDINKFDSQILGVKDQIKTQKSRKTPMLLDINVPDTEEEYEPNSGYKFHCPFNGCNGYFYENKGDTCIICNSTVCKKCESVIKSKGHKCDSDVLANVLLLKNDTKGCPKCSTLIYKISGCDQMYCTKCKTPFSWNTGEIDNTSIHNPHYFNELRQNGGFIRVGDPRGIDINQDNMPCEERMIDTFTILQITRKIQDIDLDKDNVSFLFTLVQNMNEIKSKIVQLDPDNTELRLLFICNDLTKEQFQKKIYARDIDQIKRNEFNYLYDLYLTITDDYLKRIISKQIEFNELEKGVDEAKKMMNTHVNDLSSIFGLLFKKSNIKNPK